MFARLIESKGKPGKKNEVMAILANELLPLLKKQPGFVDFIAITGETRPDDGFTMSFWATKEEAEKFWNSQEFEAKIMSKIKPLVEGMTVRPCNVEISTFHKFAAGKAA